MHRGFLMSKWPILAGLVLATTLGACGSRGPDVAYTSPGWYLERPRLLLAAGPEIFAGPMTYDACEAERTKFEYATASRLLCINEKMKPGPYGPYTPSPSGPSAARPL
jgi:hypothetical protein